MIRGVILFILSLWAMFTHAASLQVAPILLEFNPNEKIQELWLMNTGDETIRAQVRAKSWTQKENQNVLEDTKDLIASPMILSIQPGQKQLVRVVKLNPTLTTEQAFRLIVDELPSDKAIKINGVQLLLQYSIPVFFKAPSTQPVITDLKKPMSLNGVQFSFKDHQLIVKNQSSHYIRLSQLNYIDETGKNIPVLGGLVGYALVGQMMQWPIPKGIAISPKGHFEALINSDDIAQPLPLTP